MGLGAAFARASVSVLASVGTTKPQRERFSGTSIVPLLLGTKMIRVQLHSSASTTLNMTVSALSPRLRCSGNLACTRISRKSSSEALVTVHDTVYIPLLQHVSRWFRTPDGCPHQTLSSVNQTRENQKNLWLASVCGWEKS